MSTTSSSSGRVRQSSSTAGLAFRVGDEASLARVFAPIDLQQFARLTGDDNALHFDAQAARLAGFADCVVHGALVNGLVLHVVNC